MQQPIQIETGSGLFEPGLICTMTQVHLVQIETIWRGMLQATQQPDKDWNWAYKLRLAARESRFEAYVVEIDKLAHGVVLLEMEWHYSQLDNQGVARSSFREASPTPLVYVEYLASAPWNRRIIEDPPYYVGIGRSLLIFSRQRSVQLGYGGRLGCTHCQRQNLFIATRECQTMEPISIKTAWYTLSTDFSDSKPLNLWTKTNLLSSWKRQAI